MLTICHADRLRCLHRSAFATAGLYGERSVDDRHTVSVRPASSVTARSMVIAPALDGRHIIILVN
jgi:hypothetical protein